MIKKELYNRTVDILVDAYLNDTLNHGDECACAVGNMIAANSGYKLVADGDAKEPGFVWMKDDKFIEPVWTDLFMTYRDTLEQKIDARCFNGETKRQVLTTGYHWNDLAEIEYAFETVDKGSSFDEWMFNGLMKVIDVLDRIHENTDTELTTQSKQRFTKQLA